MHHQYTERTKPKGSRSDRPLFSSSSKSIAQSQISLNITHTDLDELVSCNTRDCSSLKHAVEQWREPWTSWQTNTRPKAWESSLIAPLLSRLVFYLCRSYQHFSKTYPSSILFDSSQLPTSLAKPQSPLTSCHVLKSPVSPSSSSLSICYTLRILTFFVPQIHQVHFTCKHSAHDSLVPYFSIAISSLPSFLF